MHRFGKPRSKLWKTKDHVSSRAIDRRSAHLQSFTQVLGVFEDDSILIAFDQLSNTRDRRREEVFRCFYSASYQLYWTEQTGTPTANISTTFIGRSKLLDEWCRLTPRSAQPVKTKVSSPCEDDCPLTYEQRVIISFQPRKAEFHMVVLISFTFHLFDELVFQRTFTYMGQGPSRFDIFVTSPIDSFLPVTMQTIDGRLSISCEPYSETQNAFIRCPRNTRRFYFYFSVHRIGV